MEARTASLALHDEASWRLPDWEAFSESGRSAWTDDARESDLESDSDASAVRVPRAPPMASTTTLTARRRPLLPLEDLRALHMRFAQERQQAAEKGGDEKEEPNAAMREAQAQIATQLERVREELRAFQHEWQAARKEEEKEKESQEAIAALAHARETSSTSTGTGDKVVFDMAVQTDIASINDDAVRQWLHLITQKMEVLTTSFHGDTTQLPLRYPLQTHLERPASGFSTESRGDEASSVASWHVGGSFKTLVGEATAERLLDLERAVACLATATRHTTGRYVSYFEGIVMQIQELHQQRLRQVVDESLLEMKNQRIKYRKRIEQLETECRAAKDEITVWQQKAESATDRHATENERLESAMRTRQQQLEHERDELVMSIEMLQREQAQATQVETLQAQLSQMTTSLELAQRQVEEHARDKDGQIRHLQQLHRVEIERLERIHKQLCSEIKDLERGVERVHEQARSRHEKDQRAALEAAAVVHQREMEELTKIHEKQVHELERRLQEAEETKRLVPTVVSVDAHVQTDDHDFLDDGGTTDERITRLKRRCKALESLLDKKFEDSSAGSVESGMSGRWSSRSERRGVGSREDVAGSRTLPLTLSMESSLNDTFSSSHAFNTPSRDDLKSQMRQQDVWGTLSNRSAGSSFDRKQSSLTAAASDTEAPSPEAMLALVRKLEALATSASTKLPTTSSVKQPDEEPDLSAATTPTRTSRPTSASLRKSLSRPSSGLTASYSAAIHSLKDPRRRHQAPLAKDGAIAATSGSMASSSATAAKPPTAGHQPRAQQNRFASR